MIDKKQPSSIRIYQISIILLLLSTMFSLPACQLHGTSIPSTTATVNAATTNSNTTNSDTVVPAFPGAEGFGAYTPGGRGGRVIEVTNLNDSGVGSLRAAIDAEGPRIVVFRVGGTIELQSRLDIQNPYITIAGQTAPGGGILLRNAPGNKQTPIRIKSHDVVLRYIRLRPGPSSEPTDTLDALEIKASQNVIIDHSSFSWATDENVNIWENSTDVTIQWSIISEGLQNSTHVEGPHSKGLLIGSEGAERITIHHTLFAHNWKRNPAINTSGLVDVINNVIFNSRDGVTMQDSHAAPKVNVIGNFFKRGPANHYDYDVHYAPTTNRPPQLYVYGNISDKRPVDSMNEALVVRPEDWSYLIQSPHTATTVTTASACAAYEAVLLDAGASLPARDAVDERIVRDVVDRTGTIIDDPQQVGGWPVIIGGEAPADSDHDGMPDAWERQYGFDPNNADDGSLDRDSDGYTNVEEYLNGTYPLGVAPPVATTVPAILANNFYLPLATHTILKIDCDPRNG